MSAQSVDLIRDKQDKKQLIPIPPKVLGLAKRAYRAGYERGWEAGYDYCLELEADYD